MPKLMTPDPDYLDADQSTMTKLKRASDLVGPLALAAGLEYKRREVKEKREADESKEAALQNQKKYGMKKGGTASSRADGIAQRGKTRGKMC
jgi:hypothetical protein